MITKMANRAGFRLIQRWLSTYSKRIKSQSRNHRTSGFTLLELLVATAIGGGIIAGLMFMVVQLTNTDLRESSRSETQREMQMALDYISAELREAVYVYNGEQLQTLSQYLPASVSANGSVPVLAFWKHHPFPPQVRERCRANTIPGVTCESGSSYSLVVYSLSSANDNNIWSNNARITRYALTEFNSSGDFTQGYVNPILFQNNFATWPMGKLNRELEDSDLRLRPMTSTRPAGDLIGTPVTVVDYVSTQQGNGNPCPTNYTISPSGNPRSFYACVQRRVNSGNNQDVILFVRGSVNGRPGYTIAGFRETNDTLPVLETRVFTRGALGRIPPQ